MQQKRLFQAIAENYGTSGQAGNKFTDFLCANTPLQHSQGLVGVVDLTHIMRGEQTQGMRRFKSKMLQKRGRTAERENACLFQHFGVSTGEGSGGAVVVLNVNEVEARHNAASSR